MVLGGNETEMKLLIPLLLLSSGGFSSNATMPQDCLSYEPASVKLKGKITRKTFAGPPNYESVKEGDTPETYWILHLSRPICVNADENMPGGEEPEKNVSDIQLIVSAEQYTRYKGIPGKSVEVSGELMHSITGHHHTNVLLTVTGIKGVRQ
jgi:hypothetical protein